MKHIIPLLEFVKDDFNNAVLIATIAHRGQLDKAGEAYVLHPIMVCSKVRGNKRRIIAVLHDVIEDTHITIENLQPYFSQDILDALDAITRRKEETYKEYIVRVKGNYLATEIKLADLEHNTDPTRYTHIDPVKGYSMRIRYAKAKKFLLDK